MNQQPAYAVEPLPSEATQRLPELVIASDDLKAAQFALRHLYRECEKPRDEQDGSLAKVLWTAALTLYGRVFDNSTERKQKITPDMFDALDGGQARHAHYIMVRNKHVAHDVSPLNQCSVEILLSPPTSETKEILGVTNLAMFAVPNSDEVKDLGNLVEFARHKLKKEIETLKDKVLNAAKKQDIDWLYNRPSARVVVPGQRDIGQNRRGWKPSKLNDDSSD